VISFGVCGNGVRRDAMTRKEACSRIRREVKTLEHLGIEGILQVEVEV
jgi:hypothetical protein